MMLSYREAWNELFRHVPSGPLPGELLRAVLVLRWDVRLLRVLLVLLRSYCREYLPCIFLQLLALIFSYCTRPNLTHI
jgi:hypothetical protein